MSFASRLLSTLDESGRLCVGIDPHDALLVQWGLPTSAAGVREFGLRTVDAVVGRAGVVKPQVAFFERFGSAGYAALEATIGAAAAGDKAKPYRAILRTATLDGERFFGLGEQYTYWDIAGRRVPIIAEEVRSRVCLCVVSCVCVVCVKVRGYV